MSVMQGKAQQHWKVGVTGGGCSSQGWRHNSASLQGPWAEQSIPGPSCWSRGCPAEEVAPRVWGELWKQQKEISKLRSHIESG